MAAKKAALPFLSVPAEPAPRWREKSGGVIRAAPHPGFSDWRTTTLALHPDGGKTPVQKSGEEPPRPDDSDESCPAPPSTRCARARMAENTRAAFTRIARFRKSNRQGNSRAASRALKQRPPKPPPFVRTPPRAPGWRDNARHARASRLLALIRRRSSGPAAVSPRASRRVPSDPPITNEKIGRAHV